MKLILVTKKSQFCKIVQEYVSRKIPEAIIYEGDTGDVLPIIEATGAIIISFLSPWIIPGLILNQAKLSINFHPAPPKYPGTGCYNFAIYNREQEFGVTCHHMLAAVDSGPIIKVVKFPLFETDTVYTLKNRTQDYLLQLFYDIFDSVLQQMALPNSDEKWLRKPYTRKDLLQLCQITKEMSETEVTLRIKATFFPDGKDGPYIDLYGYRFKLS